LRDFGADFAHPSDLGRRVTAPALRLSNLLRDPVPERLEVVDPSEGLAPLAVAFGDRNDRAGRSTLAPSFQRGHRAAGVVAQHPDVQHYRITASGWLADR